MGNAYGIQKSRARNTARRKYELDSSRMEEIEGEDNAEGKRCTAAKCKSCCKSFTAFLFSTVGLVIVVCAYSAAGGFLFQMIEAGTEQDDIERGRDLVFNLTERYVLDLWDITRRFNILYKENWTMAAREEMIKYQVELYKAVTDEDWDGKETGDKIDLEWNFAGALLYAVTAITTIGYGHVTPKTQWGKISTILYCVVGLPLTLMCIANLGKFFARVFRIIYHTICCGICCVCCLSCHKKKLAKKLAKEEAIHSGGVTNLESVGNGRPIVISNDPKAKTAQQGARAKFNAKSQIAITKAQVWIMNVKKKFNHSLRDDVTVPAYLCLVVMAGYIMGGALLFSLWDEWDYLTGAYFCFVTLTTIGFGDYVPGIASIGEEGATERLILCSLYVFLGLALVGMCIDLMQADVLQKLKWVAQKIGVMSNDNKKISAEERANRKSPENEKGPPGQGLEVDISEPLEENDSDDEEKFSTPSTSSPKGDTTFQFKDEDGKSDNKTKPSKKQKKKELKAKKKSKTSSTKDIEAPQSPTHKPLLEIESNDMEIPNLQSEDAEGQIERVDGEGEADTNINNNASVTQPVIKPEKKQDTKDKKKDRTKEKKDNKSENKKGDIKVKKEKENSKKSKAKPEEPCANNTTIKALVHPPAVDLVPPDSIDICAPPPPYEELSASNNIGNPSSASPATSSSVTTPATPASHYDDLPSHISSLTPNHTRLQDVETPHRPIPPDGLSLKSYADLNHNGETSDKVSPSSEELLDNVLNNPLFTNSKSSKFSMQLDDEEDDELLLTVSRASNV